MEECARHAAPNPGLVAIVFTALFLASLIPVTLLVSEVHFPAPTQSTEEIVGYFQTAAGKVRLTAFCQFASAIPLGIFTAVMVSRLRYLGVRAAGVHIALVGGLTASLFVALSALIQWTLGQPNVASNGDLAHALFLLLFATGGPGYSVPLGLLIAGISVSAGFAELLPRWLVFSGVALAIIGELSALDLLSHRFLLLIPLTRFPAFVWMIAAGFMLPDRPRPEAATAVAPRRSA